MTAMPPNFDPLRFCDRPRVTAEERQQWIATAAYFRAQRRGFTPGQETSDWIEAEAEVAALVAYQL
ncbi:MAG TPA: DUF2934 domain-containing protein [Steroidobacteraceae bacterium]|jgi:hypothetical protein